MDDIRITSKGVEDGPLTIPPFELRRGQALCLQIPYPVGCDIDIRLAALFLGRRSKSGLWINSRVRWVEALRDMPRPPHWLDSFLHKMWPSPRTVDWLRKNGRLSHEQATVILDRLGIAPQLRCNRFCGTPKTLMKLEGAWANGAEVVVLSICGLDPLGRQAVFAAVTGHLQTCSTIYLAYPYLHQWQLFQDAIPGIKHLALGYRGSKVLLPFEKEKLSSRAS